MNASKFFRAETASFLIGIVSLGIVCLFVGLGFYSFPAADDFAYFDQVKRFGFWSAQREWYLHWSGRYAATAAMSVFAMLPDVVRYYFVGPLSAIGLSLMAVFVFFRSAIGRNLTWLTTALCALAFWAIYISGLPNIAQSVYWDMGIADYQFANVGLLLLLAVAARRELGMATSFVVAALHFLAAALITVMAVGSNELTMFSVLTILTVLLVSAVKSHRAGARFWLAVLMIAMVCSSFSLSAPGDMVRAASLAGNGIVRPPAWLAIMIFVPWVGLRIVDWLANPALWTSAVLLYFATHEPCHNIFYRDGRFQNKWFYFPVTWVVLLFALYGIGFLVNRYPLPDRAECVVYLVFLLGCYPTFIMLAHRLFKTIDWRPSAPVMCGAQILLVISLMGSASVFEAVKDIYRGHRYAVEMSRRFEMIKRDVDTGQLNPVVPVVTRIPRTISVAELSTDPGELANALLAKYYGLNSIRLGEPGSGSGASR